MNSKDQFWQDIAPIENRQRSNFGTKKAPTLVIGVPYLIISETNMPPYTKEWAWAGALALHLGFLMVLLTIPPIELPPKNIVQVKIITAPFDSSIQEPKLQTKTPVPPKIEKALIPPKNQVSTRQDPLQLEAVEPRFSVQVPPIDAQIPDAIVDPLTIANSKKLQATQSQPLVQEVPIIEDEPKEQVVTPQIRAIAPEKQVTLRTRQFELQRPIVEKELAGHAKLKNQQIAKIHTPNVKPIDIEELNRLEAQRALESSRQSIEPITTAPSAKGGELAPSGGPAASAQTSGVTSIAGGEPAAGGNNGSASSGVLPRQPRGAVPSQGVFNNNGASGGLAGMRRIGECAELNRERSDRCPDWNPLEPNRRQNIAQPIPKGVVSRTPPADPLPLCPPGTPHSNFGITCLPSGRQ